MDGKFKNTNKDNDNAKVKNKNQNKEMIRIPPLDLPKTGPPKPILEIIDKIRPWVIRRMRYRSKHLYQSIWANHGLSFKGYELSEIGTIQKQGIETKETKKMVDFQHQFPGRNYTQPFPVVSQPSSEYPLFEDCEVTEEDMGSQAKTDFVVDIDALLTRALIRFATPIIGEMYAFCGKPFNQRQFELLPLRKQIALAERDLRKMFRPRLHRKLRQHLKNYLAGKNFVNENDDQSFTQSSTNHQSHSQRDIQEKSDSGSVKQKSKSSSKSKTNVSKSSKTLVKAVEKLAIIGEEEENRSKMNQKPTTTIIEATSDSSEHESLSRQQSEDEEDLKEKQIDKNEWRRSERLSLNLVSDDENLEPKSQVLDSSSCESQSEADVQSKRQNIRRSKAKRKKPKRKKPAVGLGYSRNSYLCKRKHLGMYKALRIGVTNPDAQKDLTSESFWNELMLLAKERRNAIERVEPETEKSASSRLHLVNIKDIRETRMYKEKMENKRKKMLGMEQQEPVDDTFVPKRSIMSNKELSYLKSEMHDFNSEFVDSQTQTQPTPISMSNRTRPPAHPDHEYCHPNPQLLKLTSSKAFEETSNGSSSGLEESDSEEDECFDNDSDYEALLGYTYEQSRSVHKPNPYAQPLEMGAELKRHVKLDDSSLLTFLDRFNAKRHPKIDFDVFGEPCLPGDSLDKDPTDSMPSCNRDFYEFYKAFHLENSFTDEQIRSKMKDTDSHLPAYLAERRDLMATYAGTLDDFKGVNLDKLASPMHLMQMYNRANVEKLMPLRAFFIENMTQFAPRGEVLHKELDRFQAMTDMNDPTRQDEYFDMKDQMEYFDEQENSNDELNDDDEVDDEETEELFKMYMRSSCSNQIYRECQEDKDELDDNSDKEDDASDKDDDMLLNEGRIHINTEEEAKECLNFSNLFKELTMVEDPCKALYKFSEQSNVN